MAPWSRSSSSGGRSAARSRISAARGSVTRASRFSSSVRVSVRSVSSSSISVESNRSPGLSGAMAGWSYRMIGEDSTTSRRPASPTSTGQVFSLRHCRAAASAHIGGSSSETNAPPLTPISRWAATSERRRASSRGASARSQWEVFSTSTRSRTSPYGPGSRSAEIRSSASSGWCSQTIRPVRSPPGPAMFSMTRSASTWTSIVQGLAVTRARDTVVRASRSVASSKLR
ncbi:hypothetical protein [Microbispora sp. CSR-4]|uniref:hypothetical protein n=1 Tax=Microbispora sp. CSR-4 TaxID=2592813 RepID=UPI001C9C341D|nr:hypothetical protein [Microbispora sp. CSR-4]